MEKAFPDMPINSGVEKVLALTTTGISNSAHTLLSLSFLIIPISLAVAIKMFHWLGPFAAIGAVLVPVAALLYAEACLAEQGILPLPGGMLYASTAGKPVYNVDGKDEKISEELQNLLLSVHGMTPPEHNPAPYEPPGDSSNDSNGQISLSSTQTAGQGTLEFSSSRPSLPLSESATTSNAMKVSGAGVADTSATAARTENLTELNQILNRTSEVLYGRQLSHASGTVPEALQVLNKLRVSIGLPKVSGTDLPTVLVAANETASTVGC